MLELHDIRESTIFKEGLMEAAVRMHANGLSVKEFARILSLNEKAIKKAVGKPKRKEEG